METERTRGVLQAGAERRKTRNHVGTRKPSTERRLVRPASGLWEWWPCACVCVIRAEMLNNGGGGGDRPRGVCWGYPQLIGQRWRHVRQWRGEPTPQYGDGPTAAAAAVTEVVFINGPVCVKIKCMSVKTRPGALGVGGARISDVPPLLSLSKTAAPRPNPWHRAVVVGT